MPNVIDYKTWDGLIPALAPELLPENASQLADDVTLERGILIPVLNSAEDTQDDADVGEDMSSIYLWRYSCNALACGATSTTTAATWAALKTSGAFKISVGGVAYTITPDFTGVDSMEAVAEAVQTAISEATGTGCAVAYDRTNTLFQIHANAALTVMTAPTAGTNLSSSTYLNGVTGAATVTAKEGEQWIAWDGDVRVVRGPINDDPFSRIYFAGEGLDRPKMKLMDAGTEVDYDIAIPKPLVAPTTSGTTPTVPTNDPDAPSNVDDPRLRWKIVGAGVYVTKSRSQVQGTYFEVPLADVTISGDYYHFTKALPGIHSGRPGEETYFWPYLVYRRCLRGSTTTFSYGREDRRIFCEATSVGIDTRVEWEGATMELKAVDIKIENWTTINASMQLRYNDEPDAVLVETDEAEPPQVAFVSYAYSFVTKYGEEGQLSPPSPIVGYNPEYGVDLTALAAAPAGRAITKKRLYRAAGGAFRWLADVAAATTTYTDTTPDSVLGEEPPVDPAPPPDPLEGLVVAANGFLAGFVGREVFFSTPWMPYAWPRQYSMTLDDNIIALAAQGNDVYVLTRSGASILTGSHPEELTQAILPMKQGCASSLSVAVVGSSVVYASPDGLIALYGAQVRNLTEKHWTAKQWRALGTTNMRGVAHDGKYFGFIPGSDAILFRFSESLDAATKISDDVDAAYVDHVDDTLYILPVDGDTVHAWEGGTTNRTMDWQGRDVIFPEPVSLGAIRIICDGTYTYTTVDPETEEVITNYYITVKLYAGGTLVHTYNPTTAQATKLPRLSSNRKWSVRVTSAVTIREACVATSMGVMP